MITRNEGPTRRGFLLMPFCQDLDWLREEIVSAGLEANVEIERADDISLPGVIIDQVFDSIHNADVVVAVCTGRNANVFFELGFAWHTHKAVLVAETDKDLPFDVQHLRTEFYGGLDLGQSRETLRERLRRSINASVIEQSSSSGERLEQARYHNSVDERLDMMTNTVEERVAGTNKPTIYVAIVPYHRYTRLFRPDHKTSIRMLGLDPGPVFGIDSLGSVFYPDIQPGFKRVRLHGLDNWMEIHDDGSFVGVLVGTRSAEAEAFFYDTWITSSIVARLTAFGLVSSEFGIVSDIAIKVGIASVGLPVGLKMSPARSFLYNAVTKPIQTELVIRSQELGHALGVLTASAVLMDDLMSAFGWPGCAQLDPDGTVVLGAWDSMVSYVEGWATANHIPFR